MRHQYDEEAKGKRSPFWIDGLKPIQLATFDLDEYRECRRQFTTDEWIDLLIRSIGIEPSHFDRRLEAALPGPADPALRARTTTSSSSGPGARARATPTRSCRPTPSC